MASSAPYNFPPGRTANQASQPPSLHISPPGSTYPATTSSGIATGYKPTADVFPTATSSSSSASGGLVGTAPPPATKRPVHGRTRSGSLVSVQRVEETHEEMLDQSAGFNANADWVNYKGAWVIHVVLILVAKILVDVIPAMQQDTSWTLVNLGYMALSYLMFHYVTGTPFESNAGAYDQLTLWEQIDEGAQYTPAKKWLTSVPIGLFLVSTHYTRYNPWLFGLNFSALLFVLFPKLPILHRLRFKFFEPPPTPSPYPSQPPTPTHARSPNVSELGL